MNKAAVNISVQGFLQTQVLAFWLYIICGKLLVLVNVLVKLSGTTAF